MSTVELSSVLPLRYEALDIWSGFDGTGGDWNAATYSAWMAGIDAHFAAEISGGSVVKTDRGACSDGANHIFSYTAGSGTMKVLLLAGQHGEERIGQYAAMRWFEQFVRSTNPLIAGLRRSLQVIWVPTASPSSYASARKNSNDVDPNRNYGFYWSRFTPPNTSFNKGSAAFSEPESQVVKTIIDEGAICLVDCHNMGPGEMAETLKISPPSPWALGKRALVYGAARAWQEVYGGTWSESDTVRDGNPTSYSWASYYNLWNKSRWNAASVLIETNADAEGSTSQTIMSAAAAKSYCGFITMFLTAWLAEGQSPPTGYPVTWMGRRVTEAASTSITSGGTLIDTTTETAITFDQFGPTGGSSSRDYLDAIYPCPGMIELYADGYIEGGGTTATRIDLRFSVDGTASAESFVSIVVPATATHRAPFNLSHRISASAVDGVTIPRIRLLAARVSAGDSVKLKRARMFARFTPNTDVSPSPNVN